MNARFLAEDFREILNKLESLTEKKEITLPVKDNDQPDDIDNVMVVPRSTTIKKQDVKNVMGLIKYLDQFSRLSKWRNNNAKYDDAFYTNLPVRELVNVAKLRAEDIKKITQNTAKHKGHIWIRNNVITIFGSC